MINVCLKCLFEDSFRFYSSKYYIYIIIKINRNSLTLLLNLTFSINKKYFSFNSC